MVWGGARSPGDGNARGRSAGGPQGHRGPLGELRNGIPTKEVLVPLRKGAPAHWFHGFIQTSHALDAGDFQALQKAFEGALRVERMGRPAR